MRINPPAGRRILAAALLCATIGLLITVLVLIQEPKLPVLSVTKEPPIGLDGPEAGPETHSDPAGEGPVVARVEARRGLIVRVQNEGRQPIREAEVLLRGAARLISLRTNADGVAAVQGHEAEEEELVVEAAATGYCRAVQRVSPDESEVVLQLAPGGGCIEGTVKMDGLGGRASALSIVAWPSSLFQPAAWLARGGGIRTQADASGRWRLEGLADGSEYCVALSGRGWAAKGIVTQVAQAASPRPDVLLQPVRLYGVLLRARDPAGREIRHSDVGYLSYSIDNKQLAAVDVGDWVTWALSGRYAEARSFWVRENHTDALLGYCGPSSGMRGVASVRYTIPGYRVAVADVPVSELEDSMPVWRVGMIPNGETGDIEVKFTPNWGSSACSVRGRPMFELQLKNSGTGETARMYYNVLSDGVVRGVAVGEYEVHLRRSGGEGVWMPAEGVKQRVNAQSACRVTFDVGDLSAVLVDGKAAEWRQRPRRIGAKGRVYEFSRGPYLVWGLGAGTVTLLIEGEKRSVSVQRGETASMMFGGDK